LGQLHSNLGEVRNVSINWKNLGRPKFQQTYQLWPNGNSSIRILAKWNIFVQFWVTSNSFFQFWKLQTASIQLG